MKKLTIPALLLGALVAAAAQAELVPTSYYDGTRTYEVAIPAGTELIAHEEPFPGFDECIEKSPEGPRHAWVPCYTKAAEYWDGKLGEFYKAAMKNCGASKACRNELRNAEREWIKWRDLQFEVLRKHHRDSQDQRVAYRHLYLIYKHQAEMVESMTRSDVSDYH